MPSGIYPRTDYHLKIIRANGLRNKHPELNLPVDTKGKNNGRWSGGTSAGGIKEF